MPLRDKGPTLVGVLWLEVGMCLLVLGLRIYTRTVIRRSLGVDDLLLVISWVNLSFLSLCYHEHPVSQMEKILTANGVVTDGRVCSAVHRRGDDGNGNALRQAVTG